MTNKTKRKKKIWNTRINERKYLVYPLHKMVKELTGVGDLDILKAESGEELARQTRIHRLDMISKWGRLEIEEGTIQAEHLLEIMRDLVDQLHEKERAMRRSE
jgi:hypothetical protein